MSKPKQDKPTPETLSAEDLEQVAGGGVRVWGDPHVQEIKPRLSPDLENGVRKPGIRVPGIRKPS